MSEKKAKLQRKIELILDTERFKKRIIKLAEHHIKHPKDETAEHVFLEYKKYHRWLGE